MNDIEAWIKIYLGSYTKISGPVRIEYVDAVYKHMKKTINEESVKSNTTNKEITEKEE